MQIPVVGEAVHHAPKLPGDDEITDPSDFNFFLLGDIGGGKKEKKRRGRRRKDAEPVQEKRSGGPSGPVGFMR